MNPCDEPTTPTKRRFHAIEAAADELLITTSGTIKSLETLVLHGQVHATILLLGSMSDECRRLADLIKGANGAADAAAELKIRATQQSLENVKKRNLDLQAQYNALEEQLMVLTTKVAETEEAVERSATGGEAAGGSATGGVGRDEGATKTKELMRCLTYANVQRT